MTEIMDAAPAKLEINNFTDPDGNPTGGDVKGLGINIEWQNGPRRKVVDGVAAGVLDEPNGAFVEDAIVAAKTRLEFFQTAAGGKFACRQNAIAITKLEEALMWLDHRTKDRQARGVEGMNAV